MDAASTDLAAAGLDTARLNSNKQSLIRVFRGFHLAKHIFSLSLTQAPQGRGR